MKIKIHKIRKPKIEEISFLILIITYAVNYIASGISKISESITVLLAMYGVIIWALQRNRKLTRNDILKIAITLIVCLYSTSTEGIRYFLLLIAIIFWSKIKFKNIINLIKAFLLVGLLFSISQISSGMSRIEGFMKGSPPQFACVLFICLTYIVIYLYNNPNNKSLYFYIIASLSLIFLTGTRSILAGALIICIYYLILNILKKEKIRYKKAILICLLIIGTVLIIFASKPALELVNSKMGRGMSKINDSNRTRMDFFKLIISQFSGNIKMILIGNGAGYVEKLMGRALGVSYYVPVHQDYLLILAEYGILGLIAIFIAFLRNHYARWIFIYMFTFCSFHNILLNTKSMLLMLVVISSIENLSYKIGIEEQKKQYEHIYRKHNYTIN